MKACVGSYPLGNGNYRCTNCGFVWHVAMNAEPCREAHAKHLEKYQDAVEKYNAAEAKAFSTMQDWEKAKAAEETPAPDFDIDSFISSIEGGKGPVTWGK